MPRGSKNFKKIASVLDEVPPKTALSVLDAASKVLVERLPENNENRVDANAIQLITNAKAIVRSGRFTNASSPVRLRTLPFRTSGKFRTVRIEKVMPIFVSLKGAQMAPETTVDRVVELARNLSATDLGVDTPKGQRIRRQVSRNAD